MMFWLSIALAFTVGFIAGGLFLGWAIGYTKL